MALAEREQRLRELETQFHAERGMLQVQVREDVVKIHPGPRRLVCTNCNTYAIQISSEQINATQLNHVDIHGMQHVCRVFRELYLMRLSDLHKVSRFMIDGWQHVHVCVWLCFTRHIHIQK